MCFIFQTCEKEQIEREKGVGKAVGASEVVEYKIEVPANRSILFSRNTDSEWDKWSCADMVENSMSLFVLSGDLTMFCEDVLVQGNHNGYQ